MKLLSDKKIYKPFEWLDVEDTSHPLREQWNKEAFEEIAGNLEEAQGKIQAAESLAEKYAESEKDIRETVQELLSWLIEEEEKYNSGPEYDEDQATRFFRELEKKVKETAREAGFWTRGRLDLSEKG